MEKLKLNNICNIQAGGTPARKNKDFWENGNINWCKISDLKGKYISYTEEKITKKGLDKSSAKLFKKDTILYTIFATIGEVSILNVDSATNQAIAGLEIINDMVNKEYLYYYLKSKKEEMVKLSRGVAQNNINLAILKELEINVPDMKIQEEIVNKLNKIEKLVDIEKEQKYLFEDLINSKFIEMFGNPNSNNKNFKKVRLRECLINIDNGKSFVCENFSRDNDYPAILKLSAVTYGYYNQEENKALIDKEMYIPSVEVKKGDLLFTRKNTPELVGMSAYVYDTLPNLMLPDLIFRLNTTKECNKIFLWKLINHKMFRKNITQISNGSAKSMSNISKERLMDLEIILPPIELQNKFADFIEKIEKQRKQIDKNLKEVETLKNGMMNKYFN